MANFALVGASGFVAPRHMRAIRETGHSLVAAADTHDAAGALDRWFEDTRFFTSVESFERHLGLCRGGPPPGRVDWVSVCTPNFLHDAHVRLALRAGCDVICEKPIVVDPGDLDALEAVEGETGRRVFTVLQLRHHPAVLALRERVLAAGPRVHDVDLRYVTRRGPWYFESWKGDEEKSGGLAMNIGVHFFDLLLWIFGAGRSLSVTRRDRARLAGTMELERARVRWLLSVDPADLPAGPDGKRRDVVRAFTVDGTEVDFSGGFEDLHTAVYREILAGKGVGIGEARPSIELVHRVRHAPPSPGGLVGGEGVEPSPRLPGRGF